MPKVSCNVRVCGLVSVCLRVRARERERVNECMGLRVQRPADLVRLRSNRMESITLSRFVSGP